MLVLAAGQAAAQAPDDSVRPVMRSGVLPEARWDGQPQGAAWTRTTMAAVLGHGRALVETVPGDIETWCPAYASNSAQQRAAFWTGMISALARHESTYRPRVVGGDGRWFGLLQISPGTARGYDCAARSGEALRAGPANLRCAVRIMAETVPRDNAVALSGGRRAGVGADWGPMTQRGKRAEMAAFTRVQSYCQP